MLDGIVSHAGIRTFPRLELFPGAPPPWQASVFSGPPHPVVPELPRFPDHPVTGDDVCNGVSRHGAPDRTDCAGRPDPRGDVFVGSEVPRRDAEKGLPYLDLKIGPFDDHSQGGAWGLARPAEDPFRHRFRALLVLDDPRTVPCLPKIRDLLPGGLPEKERQRANPLFRRRQEKGAERPAMHTVTDRKTRSRPFGIPEFPLR